MRRKFCPFPKKNPLFFSQNGNFLPKFAKFELKILILREKNPIFLGNGQNFLWFFQVYVSLAYTAYKNAYIFTLKDDEKIIFFTKMQFFKIYLTSII